MTVIVPFWTGGRQLKIELEEPIIYLRGPSTSTRSYRLRGVVVLYLSKPLSATSVDIKFVGKSRTDWPEGIGPRKTKMLHDKTILEMQKTLHQTDTAINKTTAPAGGTLPAGTHRWPFEFTLPYSMVETVQVDSAHVSYYLSATVRRPGQSSVNLKRRRDMLVLRIVQPDDDDANSDALAFEKRLACADVGISIDRAIVVAGTQLPLEVAIAPHIKGVALECISTVLREHKVYRLPAYNACRSEVMNIKIGLGSATSTTDPNLQDVTLAQLHHAINAKNAHIPLMSDTFVFQLMLKIPTCNFIHHSTTWSELEFRHCIQVRIELTVPDAEERAVAAFKIPITVLDCRLKDIDFALPAYEDAVMNDIDKRPSADRKQSAAVGPTKESCCCPCYVSFQKNLRTNRKEWFMAQHQHQHQSMLPPPPAYEQL